RSGVWERILHLAVVVIAAVVGPATVRVAKRPLPRVCSLSRMVEGEGFEPSKAEPADLQSAPFDRSGTPPTKLAIVAIWPICCKSFLARPQRPAARARAAALLPQVTDPPQQAANAGRAGGRRRRVAAGPNAGRTWLHLRAK